MILPCKLSGAAAQMEASAGRAAAPEWERSKGFGGDATNKQTQPWVPGCPACRIVMKQNFVVHTFLQLFYIASLTDTLQ